jgi:hypothetical protein
MPFWVVAEVAGGWETVNPPTGMVAGTPPLATPSQLGAETVPVPGKEWHELQSVLPDALVKELWS